MSRNKCSQVETQTRQDTLLYQKSVSLDFDWQLNAFALRPASSVRMTGFRIGFTLQIIENKDIK